LSVGTSAPLLYHYLREKISFGHNVYNPPSLDTNWRRHLSLNLAEGNCRWQPPKYDVPEDLDLHKTIIQASLWEIRG
ncbi:hypothetical protein ACHAWF_014489, partial [Thalassiosira exigua]